MVRRILKQPKADLKANLENHYTQGLIGLKDRLSLAHKVAHQLVDKGCPPDMSAQTFYYIVTIVEQIDKSFEIIDRLNAFLPKKSPDF